MTKIPEKEAIGQDLISFYDNQQVLDSIKDADSVTSLIALIKAQALAVPQDMATAKGRKEIISLGERVKKTRIYIEDRVKERSKEMKTAIDELKGRGELVASELNLFIEEIKAPVYEFNAKEETRKAGLINGISIIKNFGLLPFNVTSTDIESRIAQLNAADPTDWQEFANDAQTAKDSARAALEAALPQVAERERLLEIAAKAAQAQAAQPAVDCAAGVNAPALVTHGASVTNHAPAALQTASPGVQIPANKFGYNAPAGKSIDDKYSEIKNWLIDSAQIDASRADYLITSLMLGEFPHVQMKG